MPDVRTILILDHGHCIDDRLRPSLSQAGCAVLDFDDGEDAWARALKIHVDCFVIDAELPYSDDGIYFINNIRAKPFYAQTPIYALFSEPLDPQQPSAHYRSYYRAGITASFLKDSGMEALLQTLLQSAGSAAREVASDRPAPLPQGDNTWTPLLALLDRAGRPDSWI